MNASKRSWRITANSFQSVVSNSTFSAEMNLAYPIPEWGGAKLRMQLENAVVLTDKGVRWFDRRQTKFHIVT